MTADGSPFDPPDDLDRRTAAVRGGVLTLVSRLGVDGVRLVRTAVLSRLLGPNAFGLMAMTSGSLGIARVLREGGLSTATVQQPGLTPGQVAASHRINAGMGVLLGAATFVFAPALGALLREPDIVPIARVLAITFLLDGFATQHIAVLARRTDFRSQSLIEATSASSSLVVAVALALNGAGVWALVGGMVTSSCVTLVMARHRSGYRPGRPDWDAQTWAMVRRGLQFVGFALLGFLGQHLHLILIGRNLGADSAGIYGRAQTAFLLAIGYLTAVPRRVAVPQMSRINDDPAAFARYFRRALRAVAVMAAPLAAFAVVHADLVVRLLLGPGWGESARLLAILAVGILVQPVCAATGWIYIARGDGKRMLRWGVVGWSAQIGGALAGLPFGAVGVAIGYTAALVLITPPCLWYAFRGTLLTTPVALGDVARPLVLAVGAVALTVPLQSAVHLPALLEALLLAGAFATAYGVGLLAVPGTREVVNDAREILLAPTLRAVGSRLGVGTTGKGSESDHDR